MTFRNRNLWIVAAALSIALPAGAQDLSGAWEMSSTAIVPAAVAETPGEKGALGTECVFSGSCQMSQAGTSLSGTVELTLVSGGEECPPEMTAELEGTVGGGGDDVIGGLMSGVFGNATFEGSRGNSFLGDFVATDGPFAGATGSWLAVRPESLVLEIPTAGAIGLSLLTLTLMAAGLWIFRSRRLVV